MEIGKIIELRRKKLGLTLEELGQAVGVSKSTVKKWESGYISNMRRDKISLLAKALDMSPTDLICSDDDNSENAPKKQNISDESIKFALFNGNEGITDEMFEEVKQFAELVKLREEQKKRGKI